jgi:hypothetical protein
VTQIQAGEHPSSMAGRGEIIIDVQYLPHEKDQFGLGGKVKREVEEHVKQVVWPIPICDGARPGSNGYLMPIAPKSLPIILSSACFNRR